MEKRTKGATELLYRWVRHPMDRGWPVLFEGRFMGGGRISLVSRKSIAGEFFVQLHHHPVSMNFGENGSSRNAGFAGISPDDSGLIALQIGNGTSVYQGMSCGYAQTVYSASHGFESGMVDVEAIDLGRFHGGDEPGYGFLFYP